MYTTKRAYGREALNNHFKGRVRPYTFRITSNNNPCGVIKRALYIAVTAQFWQHYEMLDKAGRPYRFSS